MKRVAILGSSGSIGTQALEVIRANPDKFRAEVLTVNGSADVLIEQALEFIPRAVVISDQEKYNQVKQVLANTSIEVLAGEDALVEIVQLDSVDIVLTALVGYAGLKPTIAAIKAHKNIALANKETLVVGGDLITELAKLHKVDILPVDSEHSAIFQCLVGEEHNPIEKIILTASGGPFLGKEREDLLAVTKTQALKHPNWTMGAKITIDSASLMNKGLEVIEAKWLFNLDINQIEVVVHPQSIIHSLVQFQDGSIKAQLGLPDMKLPIQYALAYPQRIKNDFPRFSFDNFNNLTFKSPDTKTFRNLALAFEAMNRGGNCPCVINAANEVVVDAFLKDRIGFLQMSDVIEACMEKVTYVSKPCYEDYVQTDREARKMAGELITL
ncbi:1-deoxy-D-xylulose-5-phosphate reductoisomerase [Solitalea koreensis]|uniref:1-deoxy-D-xylulose 5-phosphate reductoisomerase n=1 Tax=Solitalea koreensis TaxID=543615 RepID=A0A521BKA9_9SPHI|nr:1-deoxy-D-xylulose-5-phosphate reductoisomerase [Solitalea koreensis]SMO47281.1 1-deoxy-D-xylulose 5-phosphate reductoisomerase [Solitalea koreensis]